MSPLNDGQQHQFDHILRTRRTIGAFRPECPPREHLLSAIELAVWAPNHKKTEPWRFTLLGPVSVRAVIDLNAELVAVKKGPEEAEKKRKQWSAVPGWLLVTCRKCDEAFQHEEDYAACCCAVQNLMLSLWSRGIGTKWSTGNVTQHPRFAEICRFDFQQERVVGLIWYGYPLSVPEQTRRPVRDFLREVP
jgi:nitroreductase